MLVRQSLARQSVVRQVQGRPSPQKHRRMYPPQCAHRLPESLPWTFKLAKNRGFRSPSTAKPSRLSSWRPATSVQRMAEMRSSSRSETPVASTLNSTARSSMPSENLERLKLLLSVLMESCRTLRCRHQHLSSFSFFSSIYHPTPTIQWELAST